MADSWWLAAKRDNFTAEGAEKTSRKALDKTLADYLDSLDRRLEAELKEGWVADPEDEDEE